MGETRAMTVRLASDLADQLDLVAAVDSQPVSEVIRDAIKAHVAARRADPAFRDGLRLRINRAKKMLREEMGDG